jgi:hypothetical protein
VKPAEGVFEKIQQVRLIAVGKYSLKGSPEDITVFPGP